LSDRVFRKDKDVLDTVNALGVGTATWASEQAKTVPHVIDLRLFLVELSLVTHTPRPFAVPTFAIWAVFVSVTVLVIVIAVELEDNDIPVPANNTFNVFAVAFNREPKIPFPLACALEI